MIKIFLRTYVNYKEYFITAFLLITSLFILSLNDKTEVRNFKNFAFSEFAVINKITSSIVGIFSSDDELNSLRKQNAELMLEVNRLRELGLENKELRAMLNHTPKSNYDLIPAKINSVLVSKVNGNLILDVGLQDSVKRGMPVINQNGLVGLVTEISEDFCLVKTIQNTDIKVTVKIQRSNLHGIMSWDGINLRIKDIPTTSDVELGDRIVTSDFSSIFPPVVAVGVVVEKTENIAGILTNLIVEPYVDFEQVKNLFVIRLVLNPKIDEYEINLMK